MTAVAVAVEAAVVVVAAVVGIVVVDVAVVVAAAAAVAVVSHQIPTVTSLDLCWLQTQGEVWTPLKKMTRKK